MEFADKWKKQNQLQKKKINYYNKIKRIRYFGEAKQFSPLGRPSAVRRRRNSVLSHGAWHPLTHGGGRGGDEGIRSPGWRDANLERSVCADDVAAPRLPRQFRRLVANGILIHFLGRPEDTVLARCPFLAPGAVKKMDWMVRSPGEARRAVKSPYIR